MTGADGDVNGAGGEEVVEVCELPEAGLQIRDTVRRDAAPLLGVRDLTTRFDIRSGIFGRASGRIHAVEGVSFDLLPGETLAMVGESGCGKSTTGRSIIRLVEPTRGSIKFAGKEVLGLSSGEMRPLRRDMQMIFQDPFASLNPRMTAGAAIAEPMVVHGLARGREADDRVIELLRRVGLDEIGRAHV